MLLESKREPAAEDDGDDGTLAGDADDQEGDADPSEEDAEEHTPLDLDESVEAVEIGDYSEMVAAS